MINTTQGVLSTTRQTPPSIVWNGYQLSSVALAEIQRLLPSIENYNLPAEWQSKRPHQLVWVRSVNGDIGMEFRQGDCHVSCDDYGAEAAGQLLKTLNGAATADADRRASPWNVLNALRNGDHEEAFYSFKAFWFGIATPIMDATSCVRNGITANPTPSFHLWHKTKLVCGVRITDGIVVAGIGLLALISVVCHIRALQKAGFSPQEILEKTFFAVGVSLFALFTGLLMILYSALLLANQHKGLVVQAMAITAVLASLVLAGALMNFCLMIDRICELYVLTQFEHKLDQKIRESGVAGALEFLKETVKVPTDDPSLFERIRLRYKPMLSDELMARIRTGEPDDRELVEAVRMHISTQKVKAGVALLCATTGFVTGVLSGVCPVLAGVSAYLAWMQVGEKVVLYSSYAFSGSCGLWLISDWSGLEEALRTKVILPLIHTPLPVETSASS